MTRELRLTNAARQIVDRVLSGERLCKTLTQSEDGDIETVRYSLEPSGRRCSNGEAEDAIASGALRPSGDGLFGGSSSQTWVAV